MKNISPFLVYSIENYFGHDPNYSTIHTARDAFLFALLPRIVPTRSGQVEISEIMLARLVDLPNSFSRTHDGLTP